MSADNGYILRQNSVGQYVLQMYFASADELPDVEEGKTTFETLDQAVRTYGEIEASGEIIEYGLSVQLKTDRPVL